MVNPATLMRAKKAFDQFKVNHPKFISFFRVTLQGGIPEGTIIEITVTKPGAESITTNMKVSASDIELFKELKDLT